MTLNTDDLILIRTLLEITAVDLEYYIQDTDYSAKYARGSRSRGACR